LGREYDGSQLKQDAKIARIVRPGKDDLRGHALSQVTLPRENHHRAGHPGRLGQRPWPTWPAPAWGSACGYLIVAHPPGA
jgi:hypothetical protein